MSVEDVTDAIPIPKLPGATADVAEELVRPVLQASSLDDQLRCLRELQLVLADTNHELVRQTVAETLLQKLILQDQSAMESLVETIINCGVPPALAAAIAVLKDAAAATLQPSSLRTTVSLLKHILFERPWWTEVGCNNSDDDGNQAIDGWIQFLLLIPHHIANACRQMRIPLPSWSTPSRYIPRLVYSAVLDWNGADDGSVTARYTTILMQRLLRRNQSKYIAMGLAKCSSTTDCSVYKHLSHRLTAKESASLCLSIVQHVVESQSMNETAASDEWIQEACPHLLPKRAAQEAFVRLAVLQQNSVMADELTDRMFIELVVRLLAQVDKNRHMRKETTSSDEEDDEYENDDDDDDDDTPAISLYTSHLDTVAAVWSQATFIRQTDVSMQQHVTHFLLQGLTLDEAGSIDPGSDLVNNILMGVSERLSSSVTVIRLGGMRLGVAMARRFGQTLHFDELAEADVATAVKQVGDPAKNDDATIVAAPESTVHRGVIVKDSEPFDDDSDWDNDGELQPYDLADDEEDLRETPRPMYLNECLDLLRTPETDEHAASKLRTALQELSALVRSGPADLADVGHHIALQLVNTENKYGMEDFGDQVLESLTALTVQEPLSVGMPLIEAIFEDLSLRCRTDILDTLNRSALELSGVKEIQAAKYLRVEFCKGLDQTTRVSGKRHLLTADPDALDMTSRTRRWGRGQGRPDYVTISNRFGSIASAWFYAIVKNFMTRKDDGSLWSGDTGSKLLSHMFVSLSVMVESAGQFPGTAVLAKDLFQLVWSFRDADTAEVRASVLCGVATSLACLEQDAVLRLLTSGSADGLPQYLIESSQSDPDKGCRDLAYKVSQTVTMAIRCNSL